MLKHITVAVTNKCNSRCVMCNIWNQAITSKELTIQEFGKLFSNPFFQHVEDLNISGGEPTERDDLLPLIHEILNQLINVKFLWLSSNGTNPDILQTIVKQMSLRIKQLYLCTSIEGDRETTKKVRGIDCYDSIIESLNICKTTYPSLQTSLSMTITPYNCNLESLNHIKDLAKETNSWYSFRVAKKNEAYFCNQNEQLQLTASQYELIENFIQSNCMSDPFLKAQLNFLKTGVFPEMDNCKAGKTFAFIRPDGSIAPCINSERTISISQPLNDTLYQTNADIDKACPCCTECCFYPQISS